MSILKIKDSQGNWIGVPTVKGDTGNGISSAVLNDDYTLTLTFTDGTTYKTPSIRGEKGEKGEPATNMEIHICSITEYDSETRIPTIANPNDKTFYLVPTEDGTSPDLFTEWVYVNGAWEMFGSAKIDLSGYLTDVQINGQSIVQDGVANVPVAGVDRLGAVAVRSAFGTGIGAGGAMYVACANSNQVKNGTEGYRPLNPQHQHESTFYGLAKAAGDTTQSQSSNAVGTYTEDAKSKIREMLGADGVYELVADETLEADVINTRWWRVYLPRRTKQVFIYVNILASTGATTLCVGLYDDVGTSVSSQDMFSGGISTTAKNHLLEYAFMSGGGLILRQYNNDNSASQLRRQLIAKKENSNEWFYSVGLRPYNEAANIPAGSRIRVFIK